MEFSYIPERAFNQVRRSYPPGFRFNPTDQHLVVHYLTKRMENQPIGADVGIFEINLYKFNPWELTAMYQTCGRDEWYFFTERTRKYPNGSRPNRAAGDGYWKATVAAQKIHHKNVCVGLKMTLVFYLSKSGKKTNWIMHEYTLNRNDNMRRMDDCVLCRIHERKPSRRNEEETTNLPLQQPNFHEVLQQQQQQQQQQLQLQLQQNLPISYGQLDNEVYFDLDTGEIILS